MKSIFALSLALASSVLAQSSNTAVPSASAADQSASLSTTLSPAATSAASSVADGAASTTKSSKKGSSVSSEAAKETVATSAVIPSGISSACTTFLNALNADSKLASCTAPLITATSEFTPSTAGSTSSTKLIAALNTLCAANGCQDSLIRTHLSNFYTACKSELTGPSPNTAVKQTYDTLYIINPLRDAVCSKDAATKEYCVVQSSSSTGSTGQKNALVSSSDPVRDAVNEFIQYSSVPVYGLSRRQSETVIQYPNMTAYQQTGLPYLFTQASLDAEALCTACTQEVLGAYTNWEKAVPYALGLVNSPMLGGQAELWTQVKEKCGSAFLSAIYSVATDSTSGNGASAAVVRLSGMLVASLVLVISISTVL